MIGVCIVTYNQEAFIAQALDSVLEQKDCPENIRIYIGNDCSSDRTKEICSDYSERYPDVIRLYNNQTNLGLVNNTLMLLRTIMEDGCDYVAMLDGDDFWCDHFKLKKQIDFLNSHPDYGFVHTRNYLLIGNRLIKPRKPSPPTGIVFNSMASFPIANCTSLFRANLLQSLNLEELATSGFMSIDYVMYVIFSSQTSFGFLEDYTATWRRGHTSVSNTNDEEKQIKYLDNDKAMWKYLGDLFPEHYLFDEDSWSKYYNYKVFNIAFEFNDYQLAHSTLTSLGKRKSMRFRIKRLIASNKFLFSVWFKLKKLLK